MSDDNFDLGKGFLAGTVVAGISAVLAFVEFADKSIVANRKIDNEPIKHLIESGVVTKDDFKAAAQKGIDDLVAVASQHFPSTVNGVPVDAQAAAQEAVKAYLAGDKKQPPVIAVPAVEKPAVPAP